MNVLLLETVFCETATKILQRKAVAQAVKRRPLTAETWIRSQVSSPCEIYGGQSGIELVYFPCTSVFSCQHHSTNTSYSSPARRTNSPRNLHKEIDKKSTIRLLSCLQKIILKHSRFLLLSSENTSNQTSSPFMSESH